MAPKFGVLQLDDSARSMETIMSETTPSQAEGDAGDGTDGEPEQTGRPDVPRTTPSQAEGEDQDEDGDAQ
ncbi:hypothetical protein [Streptomyces arenae]|uniref:hypothetical protein n=1 Tax=Streptomyces arenae TaxID=29301 RepID=UPI00265A2436|nr:hypothetical protein [Streptomyces arenae]MCG7202727.1 hypothetical protein [Streptomyces arenae]